MKELRMRLKNQGLGEKIKNEIKESKIKIKVQGQSDDHMLAPD